MSFDLNFLVEDPDFIEDAIDLLPGNFKSKVNINKIFRYVLQSEKDFNDSIIQLAELHRLLTAESVYLDNVGSKFGVRRTSEDDDIYRNSILITTLGVRLNITRDNIVRVLRIVTGDDFLTVDLLQPNTVIVTMYAPCFDSSSSVDLIENLFPINTNLIIQTTDGVPFGFSDNSNPGSVRGFIDINDTFPNGGRFVNIVYTSEGNL